MITELSVNISLIENRIFTVRGMQVMVDYHLAELYSVETRRINEQVKRNIERFPEDFMFQLTDVEWQNLHSQIEATSLTSQNATLKDNRGKHRKYLPYVFTEQGVAGLSGVLKSETAVKVHVAIIRAFVALRKIVLENSLVNHRLEKIELNQLETIQKFEQVFKALESKNQIPTEGVFYDGQVFDAYVLIADLVHTAKKSIVLIDNYIDESVLVLLSKKMKNVKVTILTKTISKQIALDVKKANNQYPEIEIKEFSQSHDRFLIIDFEEVYHIGASLKDLGKKWFAFSKLDKSSLSILNSISDLI